MGSLNVRFPNQLRYFTLRYLFRVKTPKDLIRYISRKYKTKKLLVQEGNYRTFAQINENINRFCNTSNLLGLSKGDCVAVFLKNCFEFIEIRLACYKTGLIFCALTDDFSNEEIVRQLRNTQCRLLVHDHRISPESVKDLKKTITGLFTFLLTCEPLHTGSYHSFLEQVQTRNPDYEIDNKEISAIGFTSGTSGHRKAVVWSHQAWISSFYNFLLTSPKSSTKKRVFLHTMPLSTVGSLSILPGLASGGLNVLLREFDVKKVAEAIDRYKVTNLVISPSFMIDLWDFYLNSGNQFDFSALRVVSLGSAPIAQSKLKALIETFGPVFQQGYGMAEVLAPLCGYRYETSRLEKNGYGTLGKPFNSKSIKLKSLDGSGLNRIIVQSKTCCEGYWNHGKIDSSSIENGWFSTTDLGSFDSKGHFFVHDRISNILRKKGKVIIARDLEEVIHKCPGIKDAAAYVSDDNLRVWVSPLKANRLTEQQVRAFCEQHCPQHWIPDSIKIVTELPYNSSGKVLKYKMLNS
ncbi:MAG: acyl--CoA ligase [Proteobacteria bacterium]|nr:acyl--CoA ligase [Pseudomonadota bacterium]